MLRRSTILAAAVLCLSACGGVHRVAAPLVKDDSTESGGYPVLASGPDGLTVRYIAGQPFGVGIVLRNRTRSALTILDARAVEPPRTLVHQIGVTLLPWNPAPCTGNHSCPFAGFLHEPFGAARPRPVAAGGGEGIAVQLDFRLGACSAVPFASAAAPASVEVTFRYAGGPVQRELVPLGDSRPRLRMPTPADCAPQPHSDIAVEGPFHGGSDWTVPGSTGDVCALSRARGLGFRSRTYVFQSNPMVRVELQLPRYRGAGTYDGGRVLVVVGIGSHGWTSFRDRGAVITVTRVSRDEIDGRFRATISGPRRTPFRAYGAWRCSLRG
ncbi:MAG: hypothetical protein ACYDBR_00180 [Gaiellaceae bacterium]